MAFLILLLAVVVAIAVMAALKKKQGPDATGSVGFPYQPAGPLFSAAERSFLGVLDSAVGAEYRVFGKVRVADVAAVRSGLGNSARQGALNRIAAKHFDFVVCRASDMAVVVAVELNDRSHGSQRAQARDELLANVCRIIQLPLLTVVAKPAYAVPELQAQFLAAVAR
jgi:hypothetical protein